MPYKGGNKSTTNHLRFPYDYYTPHGILEAETMTEAEARKEYSRLRSIARKRLERFVGTEWEDENTYKYNKERYKPLDAIKNFSELAHLLGDVASFLSDESHPHSVSALEKKRELSIKTLHENDYTFITKKNFKAFGEFMEEVRARKMHVRGSPEAELFAAAQRKGIPPEDLEDELEFWINNRRILDAMPKIRNNKPHSAEDYKEAIERIKEKRAKEKEKAEAKKTPKKKK